ncbi:MAG TPA: hypothetical protein PLR26_07000 [Bacilli bacterium]|nr:hypothetical protein [Bacilli bacterium]
MKLYRLKFSPLGPLTKVPDSLAFFGALIHHLKTILGRDQIELLLQQTHEKNPAFVVSSFFPGGLLPIPLDITPELKSLQKADIQTISLLKSLKKVKWITLGMFKEYRNLSNFNEMLITKLVDGNYVLINQQSTIALKSEVDQATSDPQQVTVLKTRNKVNIGDDTSLYYNKVSYYKENSMFDVYLQVRNEELINQIKLVFDKFQHISVGGKKSVGSNLFLYIGIEQVDFSNQKENKLLLSKAIISSDIINIDQSFYKLQVLDNKFATQEERIYKKELLVMLEGSIVHTTQPFIGNLVLEDSTQGSIYTNAIGLLI